MKTEHEGIEITYNEHSNEWEFVLRGRSRSVESLSKAKEAIAKEPKEKRAPFPRFDAYYFTGWEGYKIVTVTSIAEDRYYKGTTYWLNKGSGRAKEKDTSLFVINDHNKALIEQMSAKERQKKVLDSEISALRGQMQMIAAPEESAL